jgi:predicted XRE-type DNA-binding protein
MKMRGWITQMLFKCSEVTTVLGVVKAEGENPINFD